VAGAATSLAGLLDDRGDGFVMDRKTLSECHSCIASCVRDYQSGPEIIDAALTPRRDIASSSIQMRRSGARFGRQKKHLGSIGKRLARVDREEPEEINALSCRSALGPHADAQFKWMVSTRGSYFTLRIVR
jgi:hypothetical protein